MSYVLAENTVPLNLNEQSIIDTGMSFLNNLWMMHKNEKVSGAFPAHVVVVMAWTCRSAAFCKGSAELPSLSLNFQLQSDRWRKQICIRMTSKFSPSEGRPWISDVSPLSQGFQLNPTFLYLLFCSSA